MTDRARWQQIAPRSWGEIASAWVETAPSIRNLRAKPDPGVDKLGGLLALPAEKIARYEAVPGLRTNALWDCLYLYRKCDHAKVATESLANLGMASWAMFNAYHSAYLGARGLMLALGVGLPDLAGRQVLLDLFPEPVKQKRRDRAVVPTADFMLKSIGALDQRAVWHCLQRTLRLTSCTVWSEALVISLTNLDADQVTPPRNHFLYKAGYWIFDDLDSNLDPNSHWLDVSSLPKESNEAFLMWLCFTVHQTYTSLIADLAATSTLIDDYYQSTRNITGAREATASAYVSFCAANARKE